MDKPDLTNPDFEPTDEQLAELMRRAFAGITEARAKQLKEMHERIARDAAEAGRRWDATHR